MKKIFLISAVFAWPLYHVWGQGTDQLDTKLIKKEKHELKREKANSVYDGAGELTLSQFNIDFGNIPIIRSETDPAYDKVIFNKDGKLYAAYYDLDTRLIGTTTEVSFADLPINAQQYINEKYPDYKKGPILLFDDNEFNPNGLILYDRAFGDEDNYFIELRKGNENIVLESSMDGEVSYFTTVRN
ncbi:MAG: hypothetical protein GC171_11840 [Terrimonas sp.]|nr:hypothetical protein [Terrimonas sp.]